MPDSLIKQQYQSLHKLLAFYRRPAPEPDLVQKTLDFNNALLGFAKLQPDLAFAQIHLYKASLPRHYNLAFSASLMTALLCVRNRFNETTTIQLMSAALSIFGLAEDASNVDQSEQSSSAKVTHHEPLAKISPNKAFSRILTQYQQGLWLQGYRHGLWLNKTFKEHLKQLQYESTDTSILALAIRLTLIMHNTQKRTKQSFQSALALVVQKSPSAQAQLLEPLLAYPSVTPPGTYIMLDDDSLALVTGIAGDKLLCYPQNTSRHSSTHSSHFSVARTRVRRVYPAQSIKKLGNLTTWWGNDWQLFEQELGTKAESPFMQSYKMSRPPVTLTAIQSQLNKPVQDINKLSLAIAREPSFAQHLRKTASQSSRQKLPIKDIQHGLMMHGFERSGSIIMQQALLSRLNQHHFPLQRAFISFVQLRGHIAASLAKIGNIGIPEQACTLAYFACVGLFTHIQLKIQTQWQKSNRTSYDMTTLVRCVKPEQLRSHAVSMAEAWQQRRHEIVALNNYHDVNYLTENKRSPQVELAAILGISLMLTRELYFSDAKRCVQSQQYCNSACEALRINGQELEYIKSEAYAICHSFSPL